MSDTIKVQFKEWDCILETAIYQEGSPALCLIDANDGEPVATASVFLIDKPLEKGQIYIKESSENEGMTQALVDAGVVKVIRTETIGGHGALVVLCELLITMD